MTDPSAAPMPRLQEEPWGRMTWLVEAPPDGADTGLNLAVMTVYPGRETPLHRHGNCTEALYVTAGRLRLRLGEALIECGPGDSALVPRDCPHAALNPGSIEASAVIAYSAGRRDYRLVRP